MSGVMCGGNTALSYVTGLLSSGALLQTDLIQLLLRVSQPRVGSCVEKSISITSYITQHPVFRTMQSDLYFIILGRCRKSNFRVRLTVHW